MSKSSAGEDKNPEVSIFLAEEAAQLVAMLERAGMVAVSTPISDTVVVIRYWRGLRGYRIELSRPPRL